MQPVITVSFSTNTPTDESLRTTIESIVGDKIVVSTLSGRRAKAKSVVMVASREMVEITELEQRLLVELAGTTPSYIEWAVVAALEDLGGTPSRIPPPFSRKKRSEVTWWETLQLRTRLFGR